MTLKTDAEVLRLGLILGLVDRSAVTAWADALIVAGPPAAMSMVFDLSLATAQPTSAIISHLRDVPGTLDHRAIGRRLAGMMHAALSENRADITIVARAMRRLLDEGLAPDDQFEHMAYHADDGVDLASSGTYGTLEAIRADVVGFLGRYSEMRLEDKSPAA